MQRAQGQGRALLTDNRFDFLRLAFACGVVVYHIWLLAALAPFGAVEVGLAGLAELSIQGFFVVSGALVCGSLERSTTLASYAGKRVRRLYPAYAVIIIIPALISGVLTSWAEPAALVRYAAANLVFLNFLQPDLPGLFDANRISAVNGALWTLKIEVMFYLVLPLLAILLKVAGGARWALLVVLYLAAEAWRLLLPVYLDHPLAEALARQLPGQMAFFASGMVLWTFWNSAQARPGLFGLIGAGLLASSFASPWLEPLRAAGLTGVIACVAFAPGPALNAARFGDISYGVYITHFPIVQALVMAGVFAQLSPVVGSLAAAGLVVVASLLLWHLVERPALRRDSHYRRAEAGS